MLSLSLFITVWGLVGKGGLFVFFCLFFCLFWGFCLLVFVLLLILRGFLHLSGEGTGILLDIKFCYSWEIRKII